MQAQAAQSDGSLPALVHDAVADPATQAAFAHVMEAAATESKAIKDISGPASAPSPGASPRPRLIWHLCMRFHQSMRSHWVNMPQSKAIELLCQGSVRRTLYL